MGILEWREPELDDLQWISQLSEDKHYMGSDVSYANIYFLKEKYDIKICFYKNFVLRKYTGNVGRNGFGFPIGHGNTAEVLSILKEYCMNEGEEFEFCLLDVRQKEIIEKEFPDMFEFYSTQDNSDYIYMQQDLSTLKGRRFHKKKNHVSRFRNKYPDYRFEKITEDNKYDALETAMEWQKEHNADNDYLKSLEYRSIVSAVENYNEMKLFGGIIYVDSIPVAMTIASAINSGICDVHFEKSYGNYANNGGYAAINMEFASCYGEYEYINREEDVGIEGLRKAKMSYHPAIILNKYCAEPINSNER